VNQVADPTIPVEQLVRDPVAAIEAYARQEGALGRLTRRSRCRATCTAARA
jgi:delta 1-pyrroline-5-carboxylate dehydrogenase